MGLSHKVEASDLRAGDHVYSWRRSYLFAHHGVYVGNNTIVDYNRGNGKSGPGPASSGSKGPGKVGMCSLEEFLGNGSLHRYQYGVSKGYFKTRRGGTCTTAISDDPATVIQRAKYMLANDAFGKYKLFSNNCENFALYCKTGLIVDHVSLEALLQSSGQVAAATTTIPYVVVDFMLFLPITVLFPSYPVYRWNKFANMRYRADIGVRKDAKRVEVEDLDS